MATRFLKRISKTLSVLVACEQQRVWHPRGVPLKLQPGQRSLPSSCAMHFLTMCRLARMRSLTIRD
jgi:hypothetical protein